MFGWVGADWGCADAIELAGLGSGRRSNGSHQYLARGEATPVLGDGEEVMVAGGHPRAAPSLRVGDRAVLPEVVPDGIRIADVFWVEDIVAARPVLDGLGRFRRCGRLSLLRSHAYLLGLREDDCHLARTAHLAARPCHSRRVLEAVVRNALQPLC